MSKKLDLWVSGVDLRRSHAGLGVFLKRLLHGISSLPDIDLKILVPNDVDLSEVAESIRKQVVLLPFGYPDWLPETLAFPWLWERLIRYYCKHGETADSVFYSPSPIFAMIRPKRFAVTIHDFVYHDFPAYWGKWKVRLYSQILAEKYARKADIIFAISEFTRTEALKRGFSSEKLMVAENWIEEGFTAKATSEAVQKMRNNLKLPEQYWLYIGGYDVRKNVPALLKAYKRLSSPPLLVLAGRVPVEVKHLLQELNLSAHIILIGPVGEQDIPLLYTGAKLVIYPSLVEGFGLPPLEAAACRTPCVFGKLAAHSSYLQLPHCQFDPKDQEAFIEKLMAAQENAEQFLAPELPKDLAEGSLEKYLKGWNMLM